MSSRKVPDWARITVFVASLALLACYVLPLWRITLEAPQYPEGLGMVILVNTIEGIRPHDLANINNLNHYIGMKRIEPDAIAELRLMPWILGFIIAWGIGAAVTGRRWMVCAWFAMLTLAAVVGLADFWRWGYDYGHNLDTENAAIKIPGMAYQPPLIGSKKLLNFTANSWPAAGGWIAIAAGIAAAVSCMVSRLRGRGRIPAAGTASTAGAILVLASLAAACAPDGPVPIVAGESACDRCVMMIEDTRFAAQLVTDRGKVHRFDSIECLAGFVAERGDAGSPIESAQLWVTDVRNPGSWIRADEARFLQSPEIRSPMGMHLAAVPDGVPLTGGPFVPADARTLTWEEVLALAGNPAGHRAMHSEAAGPGSGH